MQEKKLNLENLDIVPFSVRTLLGLQVKLSLMLVASTNSFMCYSLKYRSLEVRELLLPLILWISNIGVRIHVIFLSFCFGSKMAAAALSITSEDTRGGTDFISCTFSFPEFL